MRSLHVFIGRRLVGTLQEAGDIWRFDYDAQWSAGSDSFDLAPGLPRGQPSHLDGSTTRPVQWYFDNLLPEELLRQAITKEAEIQGDDAFALLEYLGAESAGSLTLLPPGQAVPDAGQLRPLPDADLSQRIANLPRQTLTAGAPKRMSIAGAQHKLLVVYHRGVLYEPEGAAASTHILKPNHPLAGAYPASVANEYLTMRLARAAGLLVPAVHIKYVPEPVYIIDRFDREASYPRPSKGKIPTPQVERLHIIDACQLLNRARIFKHSGATLEALGDVIARTSNRLDTRLRLFRWLVFNAVVANDDCHLKNLSFNVSAHGIQLAPHYDLLSTGCYHTKAFADEDAKWPQVDLAIPLPHASQFGDVTKARMLEAGDALGVPRTTAERILTEVVDRVRAALPAELAALRAMHAALPPEAQVHAGGEDRLLRVMENIVLAEMMDRLSH